MKVYLVRHGETEWNRTNHLQGSADNPLNAAGLREAVAASLWFQDIPFERAYCSPLMRARETCRIMLLGRKCPVQILDCIAELNYGICEGDDIDWIRSDETHPVHNFFMHPEAYVPARGGETLEQLQERCVFFIQSILLPVEKECKNLLVVTHGAFIKGMMQYLEGRGSDSFWKGPESGNCALTMLDCTDGVLTVAFEGKNIVKECQKRIH